MSTAQGPDVVTLFEGTTFCLSAACGDITQAGALGLFAGDTRVISRLELSVGGERPLPMLRLSPQPQRARFILCGAPAPGKPDRTLLVVRDRLIRDGLDETLTIDNLGTDPAAVTVTVTVDADFADVFAVKEGRVSAARAVPAAAATVSADGTELRLRPRRRAPAGARAEGHGAASGLPAGADAKAGAGLRVSATGDPLITPGSLAWQTVVPAHGRWSVHITARASAAGAAPRAARGEAAESTVISSDAPAFNQVLARSAADLAALRIHDPDAPGRHFAAAGAPWFMTLFGRDSLLTAWMALPLDPGLAVGTLQILAGLQGRRADRVTEEQPGRIIHELRRGPARVSALGGGCYYGTVDATPLFVMLLGEAWRWGASEAVVRELLPAADAALEWMTRDGDRDGDGFIEYQRPTRRGLANQGWKDSPGSITHTDGRPAVPPIALCEVQGYAYAAWLARADLAAALRDEQTAARCRARAARLRDRFCERFWLPALGWYAVALDGGKQPVTALTSNTAHCLWTGIATDEHAAVLIDRLAGAQMDTGFGLRTLAKGMGAYNPMSYHNGSVWPHDTAIAVAGLIRYAHLPGAADLAGRLATGLLDAICASGGRPPELYCGFDRAEFAAPVPYPTSCSPQAWASAAPLLMLRAFCGLEPNVPQRRVTLRPLLPDQLGAVTLAGLRLGPANVRVTASGHVGGVAGLPPGWSVRGDDPPDPPRVSARAVRDGRAGRRDDGQGAGR